MMAPTSRGIGRPRAIAVEIAAAASNVPAGIAPAASIAAGSPPRKLMTTGLPTCRVASSTRAATDAAGGFEIRTMTAVPGSAARRSRPASIIVPPTRSSRSRPPTPIACETPAPNRSMRQLTCWRPVPDAATRPIEPRRTTLAKPSGIPSRIAVPQSGPITKRPFLRAIDFSSISSSIGTLSLNTKTLSPRFRAFMASAVA